MTYEKLGHIVNGIKLCLLLLCIVSSFLQVYIMVRAVKYIRRRVGDRNLHLFLLNMTFADLILTGMQFECFSTFAFFL